MIGMSISIVLGIASTSVNPEELETFHIQTEAGENITTESGDRLKNEDD